MTLRDRATLNRGGPPSNAAYIGLRRRNLPGVTALPTLATSPPTATLGTASAASAISGSILMNSWEPGRFSYFGTVPGYVATFPNGYANTFYSASTSKGPWAAEFDFHSLDGRFEVKMVGAAAGVRVLVDGRYVTQGPTFKPASDGLQYFGLIDLAAAGRWRIRLEFDGNVRFLGIQTLPTASLTATPTKTQRWVAVGDSYTEPTIIDSSGNAAGGDGWVQQLGYMLGVDAWSCGSGGTGYLNPGGGGRVKFRDRIADWTSASPDVVMFAGGINDYSGFTAADIGTEAAACFTDTRAALPNVPIVVIGPWWPRGYQSYAANLLATSDAIKAAALAVGATWIDPLRLPVPYAPPGTTTATTSLTADSGAGIATVNTAASLPVGTYFQIGTGSNAEVRRVTGVTGSGPYTLQFSSPPPSGGGNVLARSHTTGETVTVVGPGLFTGSGRQTATAGDGNADQWTGSDATHPTVAGHAGIGRAVFGLLAAQLPT